MRIEGPVYGRRSATFRLRRLPDGSFLERRVEGRVLERLGLLLDNPRRETIRIRTGPLDDLFARYDRADYGHGRAGLGVYRVARGEEELTLCIVDDYLRRNKLADPSASLGPQRIVLFERAGGTRSVSHASDIGGRARRSERSDGDSV